METEKYHIFALLIHITQNRFGRKTEKTDTISTQLSFDPETMEIINEAEMLLESADIHI